MTRLGPEQPLLLLARVNVNDFDVFFTTKILYELNSQKNMTFVSKKAAKGASLV